MKNKFALNGADLLKLVLTINGISSVLFLTAQNVGFNILNKIKTFRLYDMK